MISLPQRHCARARLSTTSWPTFEVLIHASSLPPLTSGLRVCRPRQARRHRRILSAKRRESVRRVAAQQNAQRNLGTSLREYDHFRLSPTNGSVRRRFSLERGKAGVADRGRGG